MDTDTCIVILIVILAYLYVTKVKENFYLKKRVDGVTIYPSKTIIDTPIMNSEVVVDGVPILGTNNKNVDPFLKTILPDMTYNKTEGILPDPNRYNISTTFPPGVNAATALVPVSRIRQNDLLDELLGNV
jgi:hypothetical protein